MIGETIIRYDNTIGESYKDSPVGEVRKTAYVTSWLL